MHRGRTGILTSREGQWCRFPCLLLLGRSMMSSGVVSDDAERRPSSWTPHRGLWESTLILRCSTTIAEPCSLVPRPYRRFNQNLRFQSPKEGLPIWTDLTTIRFVIHWHVLGSHYSESRPSIVSTSLSSSKTDHTPKRYSLS